MRRMRQVNHESRWRNLGLPFGSCLRLSQSAGTVLAGTSDAVILLASSASTPRFPVNDDDPFCFSHHSSLPKMWSLLPLVKDRVYQSLGWWCDLVRWPGRQQVA